ncbi:MAG: pantetheine-phosphate adenylyltransferase [Spirochaetaceae bacterium]|nr:pantetheine-phosphate adenylyltransferase [Spirochaetaceae bacterium]
MQKAAFAGSFDPPTFGHLDIVERAARLCGELTVVVADNLQKQPLFSAEERAALLRSLVSLPNVTVAVCPPATLLVDFLKTRNIHNVVRGIRSERDFAYEADMARINTRYYPELETIFLPARPELEVLSSSVVRQLALCHASISCFVPEAVAAALHEKISISL